MINIIALFVVLFDVAEKLKGSILSKLTRAIESKKIAHREATRFPIAFYLILIASCALFAYLYIAFWCCGLGNDIISIVALAISILDDEIVALGTFLYKV